MTRVHPIAQGTYVTQKFTAGKHDGTDYRASVGTPLYASQAGVIKTGTGHPRAGTWVEIHNGSTIVGYSHMSSRKVSAGQSVKAGQLIGYSGNTGNTTGPHLHFYVKVGGKFVDPVKWLVENVNPFGRQKLAVDGALGAHTITEAQLQMGTRADGVISKPSAFVRAVQTMLNAAGATDWEVKRLVVDGYGLGSNRTFRFPLAGRTRTIWALQKYLGIKPDGYLDRRASNTVKELQRRLNSGTFRK